MKNYINILVLGAITSNGYNALGINKLAYGAGWVENLLTSLKEKEVVVTYVFVTGDTNEIIKRKIDKINYIAVPETDGKLEEKELLFESIFKNILEETKPDLVHIIGTEREYNYSMFKAFNNPLKTIISLTGLITFCASNYLAGIDEKELKKRSIGDVLRNWGPLIEQKCFHEASVFEQKLLKEAKHVFGRTTWDRNCSFSMNPSIDYISCGEVINPIFSEKKWNLENCEKHSIFVSQASYPLKGFHFLIKALPIILKKYPDVKVYVAGYNMFDSSSLIAKIKRSTYGKYLLKLIKQEKIQKSTISFVGYLNPESMLNMYLRSNVYVLSSSIENSPNSLGEAMMLGVPSVASRVGGVPDIIENEKNGLLYPFDNYFYLAGQILKIFDDSDFARTISENAKSKARTFFNKEEVIDKTFSTYEKLLGKK